MARNQGYAELKSKSQRTLYRPAYGPKFFCSYSWKDKETVRPAIQRLNTENLNVFIDINIFNQALIAIIEKKTRSNKRPILEGTYPWDLIRFTLEDAIEESNIVLYWLSGNSASSDWVRDEIEYAQGQGLPIIAIRIEDAPLPKFYNEYPVIEWEEDEQHFQEILNRCNKRWRLLKQDWEEHVSLTQFEENEKNIRILLKQLKSFSYRIPGNSVWITARVNRLLEERFELCKKFDRDPRADKLQFGSESLTANDRLIGRQLVPLEKAKNRSQIWPRYCARCGAMTNYDEVYPDITIRFLGCECS